MEREVLDRINYWAKEAGADRAKIDYVMSLVGKGLKILEKEEGVIAYVVLDDLVGRKTLVEVFFYIRPKCRDLKTLNNFLAEFEKLAIIYDCKDIKIGANFGYNDEGFAKYLMKKGYAIDILTKEVANGSGN